MFAFFFCISRRSFTKGESQANIECVNLRHINISLSLTQQYDNITKHMCQPNDVTLHLKKQHKDNIQ